MASNKSPIFFNSVASPGISFVNGDGTATKSLFTATGDGGGLNSISATSTDTVAVTMVVTVNDGTTDFQVGEVTIPAEAGTDGSTPAINLLAALELPFLQNDGSLLVGPSGIIKINPKVAVAGAFQVDIVGYGGNYATT